MIVVDAAVYDAEVVRELEHALGTGAVRSLLRAFAADLRVRPGLVARHVEMVDLPGARASAHALMGAALVLGARSIAAAAKRIESAEDHLIVTLTDELMRLPGIAQPSRRA